MSAIHLRVVRLVRAAVLAMSVGALAVAVSVPAQANDPAKADASRVIVTRVIDLSDETMPESKLARAAYEQVAQFPDEVVEIPGAVALPAGVNLSPGEVVQVDYADGVVVHAAPAAGCTITRVANKPIKYTAATPHRATATHSVALTSGCSNGRYFGELLRGTAPNGFSVAMKEVSGTPNTTTFWATYKNCQTTASWKYYSETSGVGGVKTSASATLACF